MLSQDVYYFSTIKKYIILFGSIFNNIVINRTVANNQLSQMINVPIVYAGKEKMLTRAISDPSIQRQDAIILPRMSFEIKNLTYDSSRKQQSMNRYAYNLSNTSVQFNYTPVPYNLHMALYLYVKNEEDGTKILEQILPFFTPDFTVKANMMDEMPSFDVPIILDGVVREDNNSEDFKQRRILIWTLAFTIKGMFYGPVRTSPVINFSNVSIFTGSGPTQNNMLYFFGLEDQESGFPSDPDNPFYEFEEINSDIEGSEGELYQELEQNSSNTSNTYILKEISGNITITTTSQIISNGDSDSILTNASFSNT